MRLDNLQVLRAVAALAVLFGHILREAEVFLGVPLPLADLPWSRGVDLFFVLSGVLIGLSLLRKPNDTPSAFLRRRALRIVPLYYLFTTLIVAVLWLAPGTLKDTVYDPAHILSSYLFVPYARMDGRIAPVLSLGWTLNYEMFFYSLAALSLASRKPWAVLLGLLALCVSARPLLPETAIAVSWTSPLLLEFAIGLGLAKLYQSGRRMEPGIAAWLILAGMLWMALSHETLPRWLAAGGAAGALTAAALFAPAPRWPPTLITLGDASYALYLSHRFVLRPVTLLLAPLLSETPLQSAVFVTVASLACLVVGVLVFQYVETPMMRWLRGHALRAQSA